LFAPKGTIKALRLQRHRASSTASEFTAKVGGADELTIVLSGAGKGCGGRTYTLRGQNVYVLLAIRIRLDGGRYRFDLDDLWRGGSGCWRGRRRGWSWRGEKGIHGRSPQRPTVGRRCDLQ